MGPVVVVYHQGEEMEGEDMSRLISDEDAANKEMQFVETAMTRVGEIMKDVREDYHAYEELGSLLADISTLLGMASEAAGKLSTYYDGLNTKENTGGRP